MSNEIPSLSSESVEIETADGTANAYLSRPDDGERHPGVLLMMDAFGVRPQIESMADRIAERGYAVLAPNVYYRAGADPIGALPDLRDPDQRGPVLERIRPLMGAVTTEKIVSDGGAYLAELERVGRGPVAITGYCMGGRLGWRIAAAYPERVAALGCFHTGGLVTEDADSPHLSAPEISAEIYIASADNDRSMTPENIATLESALREAGASFRSEVYEKAQHGYTMADTAAYEEGAAERHYRELFGLLERSLGAPVASA